MPPIKANYLLLVNVTLVAVPRPLPCCPLPAIQYWSGGALIVALRAELPELDAGLGKHVVMRV